MDSESLDKIDKLWESAERLGFIGHFLSVWAFLFHPRSFWGNVRVVREDIFHLKYVQQEGRCFEKMTRDILG